MMRLQNHFFLGVFLLLGRMCLVPIPHRTSTDITIAWAHCDDVTLEQEITGYTDATDDGIEGIKDIKDPSSLDDFDITDFTGTTDVSPSDNPYRIGGSLSLTVRNYTLPPQEMAALRDLFYATNGSRWKWSYRDGIPWDFSVDHGAPSPCGDSLGQRRWEGIKCTCNVTVPEYHPSGYYYYYSDYVNKTDSYSCNVYKMYLNQHNLRGALPSSLFVSFRNLTRLHLGTNSITGTLPAFLSSPSVPWPEFQLRFMNLSTNSIHGKLPTWLSNYENLEVIYFRKNLFSSTIPSELGLQLSRKLVELAISSNRLTGTIPTTFCGCTSLKFFSVQSNKLVSTVPTCLQQLTNLAVLSIRDNGFTGPFPNFVTSLTNLIFVGVGGNPYNPSILSSQLQSLKKVRLFLLHNARLFGTIPSELSVLKSVQVFRVNSNNLTGTVPTFLCSLQNVVSIRLDQNSLDGTVPSCLAQSSRLQTIALFQNSLTGTIPTKLATLVNLNALLLHNNQLRGNLDDIFDPTIQTNLQYVDVSQNAITGTLPDRVFALRRLSLFVASVNCMHGTLPQTLCGANSLETLFLAGLSLSELCSDPIAAFGFGSKIIKTSVDGSRFRGLIGSVPSCLLGLPQISNLVLSGNDLTGSLPTTAVISSSLVQLKLSHNQITGVIPKGFQQQAIWKSLDLSFNRLTGTLDSNFTMPESSELFLTVNRLSGYVPTGILELQNVSVLDGNYFSCTNYTNGAIGNQQQYLPIHDPAISTFQCGSDDANLSLIITLVALAFIAMCTIGYGAKLKWYLFPMMSHIDAATTAVKAHSGATLTSHGIEGTELPVTALSRSAMFVCCPCNEMLVFTRFIRSFLCCNNVLGSTQEFPMTMYNNILAFEDSIYKLRYICTWITALTFVFMLLVYVPLTFTYGSLEVQNAWTLSAGYLEGTVPAIVLFLAFVTLLFLICVVLSRYSPNKHILADNDTSSTQQPRSSSVVRVSGAILEKDHPRSHSAIHRWKLFGVIAVNLVVVLGVNLAYVTATLSLAGPALAACSFALSLLKIALPAIAYWASYGLIPYSAEDDTEAKKFDHDRRNLWVHIVLSLLNTIFVPCLVIAIISPNCTRYAIFNLAPIKLVYTFPLCLSYTVYTATATTQCSLYGIALNTEYFTPAFKYNYTCSSTLMASYASVFVYYFLTISFVIPFIGILAIYMRRRFPEEGYRTARENFLYDVLTNTLTICGPVYEHHDLPPYARLWNRVIGISGNLSKKLAYTASEGASFEYFEKIEYVFSTFQIFSIMITFGLVFPPLCILGLIAICIKTEFTKLMVRQFIYDANQSSHPNHKRALAILNENFNGCARLQQQACWWAIPVYCLFSTFFVFDPLGDVVGASNAVWGLILLPAMSVLIYVVRKFVRNKRAIAHTLWTHLCRFMSTAGTTQQGAVGINIAAAVQSEFHKNNDVSSTGVEITLCRVAL